MLRQLEFNSTSHVQHAFMCLGVSFTFDVWIFFFYVLFVIYHYWWTTPAPYTVTGLLLTASRFHHGEWVDELHEMQFNHFFILLQIFCVRWRNVEKHQHYSTSHCRTSLWKNLVSLKTLGLREPIEWESGSPAKGPGQMWDSMMYSTFMCLGVSFAFVVCIVPVTVFVVTRPLLYTWHLCAGWQSVTSTTTGSTHRHSDRQVAETRARHGSGTLLFHPPAAGLSRSISSLISQPCKTSTMFLSCRTSLQHIPVT